MTKQNTHAKQEFITESTFHEMVKMTGWSVYSAQEFSDLQKKQYTLTDIIPSYRVVNYWAEQGLLDDNRATDKGWRKYSLIDVAMVIIFKALRDFGVSIEKIKAVKTYLQTPIRAVEIEGKQLNLITFAVLYTQRSQQNKNLYLYIYEDGSAFLGTSEDVEEFKAQNPAFRKMYIAVNLNEIWADHFGEIQRREEHLLILSREEVSVINSLRRASVKEIHVLKEENRLAFIEEVEEKSPREMKRIANTLSPYIKHLPFGEVDFKWQRGGIQNFVVRVRKKLGTLNNETSDHSKNGAHAE